MKASNFKRNLIATVVLASASISITALTTSIAMAETASSVSAAESTKPVDIIKDFLQNTAPDKIDAAAKRLVATDATYISLNFDNPEMKQILPWAGTSKGPEAFSSTFARVAKYWKIEDFKVTDMFGTDEDVAVFGEFTYRSISLGKSFRSPFSIHAKVKDNKITYFQFMEDTYASTSSFRKSGNWLIQTSPSKKAYKVGLK